MKPTIIENDFPPELKEYDDTGEPDYSLISEVLHDMAIEAWEKGDIEGMMLYMGDEKRLFFVENSLKALRGKGLYEKALLCAWVMVKNNWTIYFDTEELEFLFSIADREILYDLGDPLPDKDEFTLYRGIAGEGRMRNECGLSWTSSPNTAAWFATKFEHFVDPAVYRITVERKDIYAHKKNRNEEEYIINLPRDMKPQRLETMPVPIKPNNEMVKQV